MDPRFTISCFRSAQIILNVDTGLERYLNLRAVVSSNRKTCVVLMSQISVIKGRTIEYILAFWRPPPVKKIGKSFFKKGDFFESDLSQFFSLILSQRLINFLGQKKNQFAALLPHHLHLLLQRFLILLQYRNSSSGLGIPSLAQSRYTYHSGRISVRLVSHLTT